MPDYTIRWIIGRALSNPAYRELLIRDPHAAVNGYELTGEDLAELETWTPDRIKDYLAELEQKIDSAVFDGSVGFVMDETGPSVNCDDALSLEDLQKLFGGS
jgi:hypothetical protein